MEMIGYHEVLKLFLKFNFSRTSDHSMSSSEKGAFRDSWRDIDIFVFCTGSELVRYPDMRHWFIVTVLDRVMTLISWQTAIE